MIWLTWRQSRLEMLLGGAALAILVVLLVWTGHQIGASFDSAGLPSCVAQSASDEGCMRAARDFLTEYDSLYQWTGWMNLFPFVLGLLLAAPIVLDLEQGTYRLAWTQSVTRSRWMAMKIAFGVALSVAVSLVLIALWTWWRAPFDDLRGRFNGDSFDFEGTVTVGYVVFAFALCLTIGTLLRRAILSVVLGLVLFMVARIGTLEAVRPHYLTPLKVTWSPTDPMPAVIQDQLGNQNWLVSQGFVTTAGRATDPDAIVLACGFNGPRGIGSSAFERCLVDQGVLHMATYQPADRFWIFQAIETTLFLGLAAGLLALSFWWVTRRMA